ncbi:MAG: CarD family transcriptional regulator [Hyphomicrobium sp.]|nr:MAG: CarD family transcriptional regulator [Hyphomicrobium sp.]
MAQKKKVEAKAKSVKPVATPVKQTAAKAKAVAASKKAPLKSQPHASKAQKPVVIKHTMKSASSAQSSPKSVDKAPPKAAIRKPVSQIAKAAVAKVAVPTKVAAKAPTPVVVKSPVIVVKPAVPKAVASPATMAMRQAAPQKPQPFRTVSAIVAKPAGQKLTSPLAPAAAVPTPKAIAEKAAQQRQMISAQKKPVSQRHGFKTNEFVVYPAHGVGRIIGIEEQEIAGMSLELFVITFDKEKLTLRVPTGKLATVGMRKLADEAVVRKAMETLKGRARVKRTMWSRRAQEYVAKINSGDLISIAEVVRDLFRSEAQPEQSYSERQLYEDALDRMAREIAAVDKLDDRGAVQRITEVLSKSAKGRRQAESDAAAAATEGGEFKAA